MAWRCRLRSMCPSQLFPPTCTRRGTWKTLKSSLRAGTALRRVSVSCFCCQPSRVRFASNSSNFSHQGIVELRDNKGNSFSMMVILDTPKGGCTFDGNDKKKRRRINKAEAMWMLVWCGRRASRPTPFSNVSVDTTSLKLTSERWYDTHHHVAFVSE